MKLSTIFTVAGAVALAAAFVVAAAGALGLVSSDMVIRATLSGSLVAALAIIGYLIAGTRELEKQYR